jgi:D-alanyl-D-alanine dipeptidase
MDRINNEILKLLTERTAYVKRAGDLKSKTTQIADDRQRVADQEQKIRVRSLELELPLEISLPAFRLIMENSIQFQQQHIDHITKGGSQMDQLVDVQSFIPQIQVELKYATPDNFTGQVVYNFQQCLLLKETALRLRDIQEELESMKLGLKIWDGFRPISAQWKFWELVPDPRYVADPREGGRHTRGTTVDLTLVTKEGKELPMPSAFDDFSEKAHQDYMGATQEEIANRELLRAVMEKHGFVGVSGEWWHFDLIGWENYPPLLDVCPQ